MSPKLYDTISEKFQNVWGDYAGWAHSVRLLYHEGGNALIPVFRYCLPPT